MTLFKIELKEFISSILYKNKDGKEVINKGSLIGIGVAIVYIIGLTFLEGIVYRNVGQIEQLTKFSMLISTYFTVLICLTAIPSSLFNSKDYLVNATLPVKSADIVTTKLLVLYLVSIVLTLFVNICSYIIRLILSPLYSGALVLFLGLIVVSILLPLFPMAICGFLGYFMSLLKGKISGGANTIVTIITFVLFMGICGVFGYSMGSSSTSAFDNIIAIIPSIKWGYNAMDGQMIDAILFLLTSTVPFIAFVVLASLSYEYINSIQPKVKKLSAKAQETIMKNSSTSLGTKQLIKKEFKKIFSDAQFVMSNLIGCFVALILPIIEIVALGGMMDAEDAMFIQVLIPFMVMMMLGAIPPANRIISYEGKDMNLTKSLPIDGWSVLKGKYYATMIIIAVVSVLYMIEVAIIGHSSVIFVLGTGVGIFGVTCFENMRVFINDLKDPHFKWNNFSELTRKESKSIINLLISLGISLVLMGLSIWIAIVIDIDTVGILYFIVGAASFVINNLTVKEETIKLYDQIEI